MDAVSFQRTVHEIAEPTIKGLCAVAVVAVALLALGYFTESWVILTFSVMILGAVAYLGIIQGELKTIRLSIPLGVMEVALTRPPPPSAGLRTSPDETAPRSPADHTAPSKKPPSTSLFLGLPSLSAPPTYTSHLSLSNAMASFVERGGTKELGNRPLPTNEEVLTGPNKKATLSEESRGKENVAGIV